MLINFNTLLDDAIRNHHIVAFFEAWEQYSLEAVIEAAEELRVPVIAGFGESVINTEWFDRRGVEEVAFLGRAAAERSSADIGLIFNEVSTYAHAVRGMHSGFNAVMLDSGHLPLDEHTRETIRIVEAAGPLGVGVEAEVGELPMASTTGTTEGGELTDPKVAARFVETTGIDALSVAVGNVHLMTGGTATLDVERVKEIYSAAGVPLVLHGGSGLPEAAIGELRKSGVAKINVGTVLKQRFLDGINEAIDGSDESTSIHTRMGSRDATDILYHGRELMKEEVIRRLKIYTV